MLPLSFKLINLKWKRHGLAREYHRLKAEATGIQWALKRNELEMIATEEAIATLEGVGRIQAWQKRFEVKK